MTTLAIEQQQHGYRNGHQLLASSVALQRDDQDVVDRLSDLSGPLRPAEKFAPYLTGYSLPSGAYYVMARTWQDTGAPRAGCVLTRSLVVPMPLWETTDHLLSLLDLLLPVDKTAVSLPKVAMHPTDRTCPPVKDPRRFELAEALFLETRQPVVMFDVPDAETICARLVSAFWPGLRRSFSFCSFALAPRTLRTIPFDLLFAPREAKAQFAQWSGRRIETTQKAPTPPRHRWTEQVADRAFGPGIPSLLPQSASGPLGISRDADESALRLSLLWDELTTKAQSTPVAVLGMLDILKSQRGNGALIPDTLYPLIIHAIAQADVTLEEGEAWQFLTALAGKFPNEIAPHSIRRQLRIAATHLAHRSKAEAIQFLSRSDQERRAIAAPILAGLGDGLGSGDAISVDLLVFLVKFREDLILGLLSGSRLLVSALVASINFETPRSLVTRIAAVLAVADVRTRSRLRRFMLPSITNSAQVSILQALLKECSPEQIATAADLLWRGCRFRVPEFDGVFVSSSSGSASLNCLRRAILSAEPGSDADRFLISTLHPTIADCRWVIENVGLKERTARILQELLEPASDIDIGLLVDDLPVIGAVIDLLLLELNRASRLLSRLLQIGRLPIDRLMRVGAVVLQRLEAEQRGALADLVLRRAFFEASLEDNSLVGDVLLHALSAGMSADAIIKAAVQRGADSHRMGGNVLLLDHLEAKARRSFVARVDDLSIRLISGPGPQIGAPAIVAWASLLSDAGDVNKEAQIRAAARVTPFALSLRQSPVGPLIVAAFPVLYSELRMGRDSPNLFSFFFFTDWDRCKTARHDLVDAFMSSSWDPTELLVSAWRAGDAQAVLRRVERLRGGERYIDAIADGTRFHPENVRTALERELSSYRSGRFA